VLGPDWTEYRIDLDYEPGWKALDRDARSTAARTVSIRLGQRCAYLVMTWHEIATHYGYKTTGLFSETRSAFTCDDLGSHAVGAEVAGAALSDDEPFGPAFARRLSAELIRLGAVDPECTDREVMGVENDWWADSETLVRYLDAGLDDRVITPMLVPASVCCDETTPVVFHLDYLNDSGPVRAAIGLDTAIFEYEDIVTALGRRPDDGVLSEVDLAILVGVIADSFREDGERVVPDR
jgi:hypothetical protein